MYTAQTLTPSIFATLLKHALISEKLKRVILNALPHMDKGQIVALANELWEGNQTVRAFERHFKKELVQKEVEAKVQIGEIIASLKN
jgi:hypothetical protein